MTVLWPNGSTDIPRVTSEFDAARRNPVTGIVQPHNGIDLIGWTDNKSPVNGVVIFAGYNGGAGNEVRIQGDDGNFYRILHHASLYVSTGQRVSAGQAVGRMGTTGQSTGVHCHFETHYQRLWNYQNPRVFVANANAGTAGGGSNPFEEDLFMALSDTQQRQMYEALVTGGQSAGAYYKTDAIINILRGEVEPAIASIAAGNIMFPGAGYLLGTAIVNTIREGKGEKLDVDEAELAKQLSPSLAAAVAPLIIDKAGTLTDETLARVAEAVADVQAERLKS